MIINLLDFMPERLNTHHLFAASVRENGPWSDSFIKHIFGKHHFTQNKRFQVQGSGFKGLNRLKLLDIFVWIMSIRLHPLGERRYKRIEDVIP